MMGKSKFSDAAWFMSRGACPVTGLPVNNPQSFIGLKPKNNYRTESAVLGERILLMKAHGYAAESDMRMALAVLDEYMERRVRNGCPLVAVEDYSAVSGADIEARRIYLAFFNNHPKIAGGVVYGLSPLFRVSYRLSMMTGALKRNACLADNYGQAIKLAMDLLDGDFDLPDIAAETGSAKDESNLFIRLKKIFSNPRLSRLIKKRAFRDSGVATGDELISKSLITSSVDDALTFISSIKWEEEGINNYPGTIESDNPLRPVVDMVAYIKSELDRQLRKRKIAETALRESEAKARRIIDHASAGIYEIDFTRQKIISVNDLILESTGYSREEFLQLKPMDLLTEDSLERYKDRLMSMNRGAGVDDTVEYKVKTRDGGERWVLLNSKFNRNEAGIPESASVIVTDITELKNTETKLRHYQKRLRDMSLALSMTEEKERKSIAGFLHDEIGQDLAAAKIQLGMLGGKLRDSEAEKSFGIIEKRIQSAIERIRFMTSELYPPVLYDFGFTAAVEWLAERYEKMNDLDIHLSVCGGDWSLSEELAVILYRAVGELLHNVVKHARADSVLIEMESKGGIIRIGVCDDGRGMDRMATRTRRNPAPSFGLFNIQERMKYFGGRMEIDTDQGDGFSVLLELPMEGADRD